MPLVEGKADSGRHQLDLTFQEVPELGHPETEGRVQGMTETYGQRQHKSGLPPDQRGRTERWNDWLPLSPLAPRACWLEMGWKAVYVLKTNLCQA